MNTPSIGMEHSVGLQVLGIPKEYLPQAWAQPCGCCGGHIHYAHLEHGQEERP